MSRIVECTCGMIGMFERHLLGCPVRIAQDRIEWRRAGETRMDVIGQNGNDGLHYGPEDVPEEETPSAPTILLRARDHLQDRAATRDTPQGERSMPRAVAVFNAATGHTLTARDGWLFMVALKMARSQAGGYNADDYEDLAAYAALYGEETAHG